MSQKTAAGMELRFAGPGTSRAVVAQLGHNTETLVLFRDSVTRGHIPAIVLTL